MGGDEGNLALMVANIPRLGNRLYRMPDLSETGLALL